MSPGQVADGAGTEAVYMNIVPTVRKCCRAEFGQGECADYFTELVMTREKARTRQAQALGKSTRWYCSSVACIEWFEGRDGDSVRWGAG